VQKQLPESTVKETGPVSEDDVIADIMGQHDQFVSSMQTRLAKLQVTSILLIILFDNFAPSFGFLFLQKSIVARKVGILFGVSHS